MQPETETLAVLSRVALFKDIPPDGLARLALLCRHRTFSPGAVLMRQGEVSQCMYVIMGGHARVERAHRELVSPLVLADLGPGEVVGEMGLLDGEPRSATVIAVSELQVVELGATAVALTLLQFPEVAMGLLHIVSQRLRNTSQLAVEMGRIGWN